MTANNNSSSSNLLPEYIKEGITLGGITGTKVVTVAQGKESQKTFNENTVLIDDYGNRVKVPAGFKIAQDSATSVTGGVVIEDVSAGDNNTKESQFVWIPIGNIQTNFVFIKIKYK